MELVRLWRRYRAAALCILAAGMVALSLSTIVQAARAARCLNVLAEAAKEAAAQVTVLLEPGEELGDEPVTFLVFGVDAGEWVGGTYRPGPGRADTIVLVKACPVEKKAAVLSIPRDTLVVIPGRPGDDKINHAYAFGGAPLLVETVELFTGVAVDYYVGLNYLAFRETVELLGGVEFEVDRVIRSRGLTLQPGLQVLDGDAAFAVVSTRADPMGDIDRVRRQQRFIRAVAAELKERDFDQVLYILLSVWGYVETNVEFSEALLLNRSLRGITEEDMTMALVPGWFYNRGGVSYWRAFPAETRRLVEELFGPAA